MYGCCFREGKLCIIKLLRDGCLKNAGDVKELLPFTLKIPGMMRGHHGQNVTSHKRSTQNIPFCVELFI